MEKIPHPVDRGCQEAARMNAQHERICPPEHRLSRANSDLSKLHLKFCFLKVGLGGQETPEGSSAKILGAHVDGGVMSR